MSHRPELEAYFDRTGTIRALEAAMAQVIKTRPKEPIRFLSNFLKDNASLYENGGGSP
jgi:hypothetical protein